MLRGLRDRWGDPRNLTSPIWGHPCPCKQALSVWTLIKTICPTFNSEAPSSRPSLTASWCVAQKRRCLNSLLFKLTIVHARHLPRPSRSMRFGDLNLLVPRDQKRTGRAEKCGLGTRKWPSHNVFYNLRQ